MLIDSAGRLPWPLVIILMTALLLTVLAGVVMKLAQPQPSNDPLPLRVSVDPTRPALDAAALTGVWTASAPRGNVMMLRLEKGLFELMVKPPGNNYNRRFSRGSFRTEGDVLILRQRTDMGKPDMNGEGIVLLPMGISTINVRAEENGRLMIWTIPDSERARIDRDVLALFPAADEKPLTWVRMTSPSGR